MTYAGWRGRGWCHIDIHGSAQILILLLKPVLYSKAVSWTEMTVAVSLYPLDRMDAEELGCRPTHRTRRVCSLYTIGSNNLITSCCNTVASSSPDAFLSAITTDGSVLTMIKESEKST